MLGLRLPELIIILLIALVIFGPGKLPSIGASIGKAINEYKKAANAISKDDNVNIKEEVEQEVKEEKKI